MSGGEHVTGDEAAAVFRRAAELDQGGVPSGSLDLAALEQAGVEAGLSRESIRQALAEIKAGAIEPAARRDAVVTRTVDIAADALEWAVERYMREQNFRVSRRLADRTVWVPARGVAATIRTVTDFNRRIVLREVSEVTTAVVGIPNDPARSHARFELGLQKARWGWYALPIVAGALGAAGVATAAALGTPAEVIAAAPGAVLLAGGAYAGARAGFSGSRRRSANGIERFLDKLERGR